MMKIDMAPGRYKIKLLYLADSSFRLILIVFR